MRGRIKRRNSDGAPVKPQATPPFGRPTEPVALRLYVLAPMDVVMGAPRWPDAEPFDRPGAALIDASGVLPGSVMRNFVRASSVISRAVMGRRSSLRIASAMSKYVRPKLIILFRRSQRLGQGSPVRRSSQICSPRMAECLGGTAGLRQD